MSIQKQYEDMLEDGRLKITYNTLFQGKMRSTEKTSIYCRCGDLIYYKERSLLGSGLFNEDVKTNGSYYTRKNVINKLVFDHKYCNRYK